MLRGTNETIHSATYFPTPLTRPAPAGENAGCGPPSPARGEGRITRFSPFHRATALSPRGRGYPRNEGGEGASVRLPLAGPEARKETIHQYWILSLAHFSDLRVSR